MEAAGNNGWLPMRWRMLAALMLPAAASADEEEAAGVT